MDNLKLLVEEGEEEEDETSWQLSEVGFLDKRTTDFPEIFTQPIGRLLL